MSRDNMNSFYSLYIKIVTIDNVFFTQSTNYNLYYSYRYNDFLFLYRMKRKSLF